MTSVVALVRFDDAIIASARLYKEIARKTCRDGRALMDHLGRTYLPGSDPVDSRFKLSRGTECWIVRLDASLSAFVEHSHQPTLCMSSLFDVITGSAIACLGRIQEVLPSRSSITWGAH